VLPYVAFSRDFVSHAVYCRICVLQCVVTLQCVLQCIMTVCVAVCRNCVCCSASLMCELQCVVTVCVAVRRDVASHAVCCSALQPLAVCCSMLQRAINQASNLCFIRFFFLATLKRLF